MQFLGISMIFKRIKAIRFMMADKSVPKRKKALVVVGIAYLFVPFNWIPVVIPFSVTIGVIFWLWILWHLRKELDNYWLGEKPIDLSRKYRKKTVIDDVNFEVKDNTKEKEDKT